jgi:hypothetical protein
MNDHQTSKPRTAAQKAASRRNGTRSHAPVTLTEAEHPCSTRHQVCAAARQWSGKPISRGNACSHGLLAKVLLFESKSREIFWKFVTHLESTFLPITPYELSLGETMAITKWRQMRLAGMERAAVRHELQDHSRQPDATPLPAASHTRAWIAFAGINRQHRTLELMNRDESRCDRQYNKALTTLLEARRLRPEETDTNQKSIFCGSEPEECSNEAIESIAWGLLSPPQDTCGFPRKTRRIPPNSNI